MLYFSLLAGLAIDTYFGPRIVKGRLLAVCADLPARAMVANMKQFNGKFGCHVCLDEGQSRPNLPMHRYYPFDENSVPRTHASILEHAQTAARTGQAVSIS